MYPNNRILESKVLKVLINSTEEFLDFSDKIDKNYFFSPIHKKIFELLVEKQGEISIDFILQNITLRNEIGFDGENGEDEKTYEVNETYIKSLFSFAYLDLETPISMLQELYLRRTLFEISQKAKSLSAKKSDVLACYDQIHEDLLRATEKSNTEKNTFKLNEIFDGIFENIDAGVVSNEMIPTHLQELNDFMFGGIPKKQLTILGARSGVGKTTTALKMTISAAQNGHSCLIFSQEMTAESLAIKFLSEVTGIGYMKILLRMLDQQEIDLLKSKRDEFLYLPITIDQTKKLTINYVRNKCLAHKSSKGLDFVFVDYAQIIQITNENEKRNIIGDFALGLDHIAQNLNCAVVLLSQLSKPLTKGKKERPANTNLSESDQILNHASNVFLLYDPFRDLHPDLDKQDIEHYLNYSKSGGEYFELLITKNRYGGRLGIIQIAKNL